MLSIRNKMLTYSSRLRVSCAWMERDRGSRAAGILKSLDTSAKRYQRSTSASPCCMSSFLSGWRTFMSSSVGLLVCWRERKLLEPSCISYFRPCWERTLLRWSSRSIDYHAGLHSWKTSLSLCEGQVLKPWTQRPESVAPAAASCLSFGASLTDHPPPGLSPCFFWAATHVVYFVPKRFVLTMSQLLTNSQHSSSWLMLLLTS